MSEQPPDAWTTTTLGTIRADESATVNPAKSPDELFELYSIPSYASGAPEIVPGKAIGSTKQSLVPGTVVVSKINPRINRVWVVGRRSKHRQLGSSEWIPFFPVEGIEPQYLAYYLRQDKFRNYLAANVSGVGGSLMRVRPAIVDPYEFAYPEAAEQRSIVAAIESYFTRLDDAVATLARVRQNLKRYRASVLKAAVEGRLVPTEAARARAEYRDYEPASALLARILTERRQRWEASELARLRASSKPPTDDKWKAKYKEPVQPDTDGLPELPEGWCWGTVEQLVTEPLSNGRSLKTAATGFPILRLSALRDGRIDVREQKIGAWTAKEAVPYLIAERDFLVSRGNGSIRLVGVGGIVPAAPEPVAYPDTMIRLRLSDGVDLQLFCHIWNSRAVRNQIERKAKTTAGIYKVNQGDLETCVIPLPPAAEQIRIRDSIERLLSEAEAAALGMERADSRSMRLRQAILKWAFEGLLLAN